MNIDYLTVKPTDYRVCSTNRFILNVVGLTTNSTIVTLQRRT